MSSPRMIGSVKPYIPNSRADIRRTKRYRRNREYTYKHEAVLDEIRGRKLMKQLMEQKEGANG